MAERRRQITGELVSETRSLLKACVEAETAPYQDITAATNIPGNWLYRFNAGHIRDPGANRVEALYKHLTGRTSLGIASER